MYTIDVLNTLIRSDESATTAICALHDIPDFHHQILLVIAEPAAE